MQQCGWVEEYISKSSAKNFREWFMSLGDNLTRELQDLNTL